MEMINGDNIGALPFKDLKKVSDLIFYDGPILSHFTDKYGKNIIFYWADFDNKFNRWILFQVTEKQLYYYLLQKVSLKELFECPLNDIFYSVEIGEILEYKNIVQIFKENLPRLYIIEDESFFQSEVPKVYERKIRDYEEDSVIESFISKSMFLKAEPREREKNRGLVNVMDGSDFLHAIGKSFGKVIELDTRKAFFNRGIIEEKRIRKTIKKVADVYQLNIAKSEAASFGVALSPNYFLNTNEAFLNRDWLIGVFNAFKENVIEIDKRTPQEIDKIIEEYGESNMIEIYKPIIDLYKNKDIVVCITDNNFKEKRKIHPVKNDIENKILIKKQIAEDEEDERLALIRVNTKTGKPKIGSATLFDQNIHTSWDTKDIISDEKGYKLKFSLTASYKKEHGLHILENDFLDIYATGNDLPEAEKDLYEQFHTIYQQITTANIGTLDKEQNAVLGFMNLIVAK